MVATLEENIAVYDENVDEFELKYFDKYVLFYDLEFIGVYEESHEALSDAMARFGRGPYLIRLVGKAPAIFPSFVPAHALDLRIPIGD